MTDRNSEELRPEALAERVRSGERVRLLDLRNREEVESWRIDGENVEATRATYAEFMAATARGEVADLVADLGLDAASDEPVVAVCPRGEVSARVADLLRDAGVDAVNLAGGMRGWARVYDATELPGDHGGATVVQYDRPSSGCLAYLVVSGGEAAVVDPLRAFAERYVADADHRGARLRYAVDTHVHADHVSGVRRVADLAGAEPVVPAGAEARGLAFDARLVADGEEVAVGDAELTALHAPGHTTELTAFRLGDLAFTGDALFLDGFGRPDLERGDDGARDLAGTLYDTLRDRLLALPDDTVVAPGHRTPGESPGDDGTYTAPLAAVRDRLDLLDTDREAFADRVTARLPPRPANDERIIAVNLGRESADDEEAFEWELGPNNCAVGD